MKLWDLENDVKEAKRRVYEEKRKLHKKLEAKFPWMFATLDGAFISIILFNLLALGCTHAIMMIQEPHCLVEANPIQAEATGLPTSPTANIFFRSLIFQSLMYGILLMLFMLIRRDIIEEKALFFIMIFYIVLGVLSAYDGVSDLGYLIGMLLRG